MSYESQKYSFIHSSSCEWFVSKEKLKMCGEKTLHRKSYCQHHYDMAYEKVDESDIDEKLSKIVKTQDIIENQDVE